MVTFSGGVAITTDTMVSIAFLYKPLQHIENKGCEHVSIPDRSGQLT